MKEHVKPLHSVLMPRIVRYPELKGLLTACLAT